MKTLTAVIALTLACTTLCAQQTFYDVVPGDGNGIRFWQSDWYKVHMGVGLGYEYGPVTSYSIKMNMSGDANRGWTWGVHGQTPVAAINTLGEMQIAGSFNTTGQIKVGGVGVITNGGTDVYANIRVLRNTSTQYGDGMYIGYMGTGGPLRFFSNSGTTEFMSLTTSGNLGLGNTAPSVWFPGRVFEMSDVRPVLKMSSSSPTGLSTIVFTNTSVNSTSHYGEFHLNHQFDQVNNDKSLLRFGAYPSSDILVLQAEGNVGIGTITPQWKLDVNGGIAAKGQLIVDSTPTEILIGDLASGDGMRDKLHFHTRDQRRVTIDENGNMGIGTTTPNQKLTVNGTAYAKEVKVDLSVPGPDYVFEKAYKLPTLEEIEKYIGQNKRLPEVPSAEEMKLNGLDLGNMNILLLKKIEEMTLHMIDMKKQLDEQEKIINGLIKK